LCEIRVEDGWSQPARYPENADLPVFAAN
jgi:hypothetical protein